jgi:hypothetical protein
MDVDEGVARAQVTFGQQEKCLRRTTCLIGQLNCDLLVAGR